MPRPSLARSIRSSLVWLSVLAFATPLALAYGYKLTSQYLGIRELEVRQGVSREPSRLRPLEFVERHPELRGLGDAEALTVARVLTEELDRRERRGRWFDVGLAVLSLGVGVVLGLVVR